MPFKKPGLDLLRKVYRQDADTGAFVIDVAIHNYEELFNSWDPAPYRIRDVDPDLLTYLELSSHEIPLRFKVKVCFRAPRDIQDRILEDQVLKGFSAYMLYEQSLLKRKLYRSGRTIIVDTAAAFVFLTLAFIIRKNLPVNLFTEVLLEGMFVGGWVFMWESISSFFFERSETRKSLREFERLADAEKLFQYEDIKDEQS